MFPQLRRAWLAAVAAGALVVISSTAFAGDHTAENKELVRTFVTSVCNEGHLDRLGEIFADDYIEHNAMPGMPGGIAGLHAMLSELESAFPDMQHDVEDLVASGDLVGIRAVMSGTNTGSMHGMPATGKRVSVDVIGIVRVEDGKIVEHWGNADDFGMMRQLGVVPAEGAPPAPPKASADRMQRDDSTSSEDAIAVTARWLDVFNRHDLDAIDDFIAADYVAHGPVMAMSGIEELKAFMGQLMSAFPDMATTVEATVAEDGMVATTWSATMTHTGDFMGMPASGKKLHMTGTRFDRVVDGTIHDHWEVVDEMSMMHQLGYMPPMHDGMMPCGGDPCGGDACGGDACGGDDPCDGCG